MEGVKKIVVWARLQRDWWDVSSIPVVWVSACLHSSLRGATIHSEDVTKRIRTCTFATDKNTYDCLNRNVPKCIIWVAKYRLCATNCSFTVAGPAAWNSLPVHIRTIQSQSAFCRHLKTHLFANWLNCINIYFSCFYYLFLCTYYHGLYGSTSCYISHWP